MYVLTLTTPPLGQHMRHNMKYLPLCCTPLGQNIAGRFVSGRWREVCAEVNSVNAVFLSSPFLNDT